MFSNLLIEGVKNNDVNKFNQFESKFKGDNVNFLYNELKNEFKETIIFGKYKIGNQYTQCYEVKYKNKKIYFDFGIEFDYFRYHVSCNYNKNK